MPIRINQANQAKKLDEGSQYTDDHSHNQIKDILPREYLRDQDSGGRKEQASQHEGVPTRDEMLAALTKARQDVLGRLAEDVGVLERSL
jgi:hypothetical protein